LRCPLPSLPALRATVLFSAALVSSFSQTPAADPAAPVSYQKLTLEQASSRSEPDYTPAFEGKAVSIRGQVSAKPILALDSLYLPIQDEAEYGFLLEGQGAQFTGLEPGDWIEADGTVGRRSGLPVLIPREIRKTYHTTPPSPKELHLDTLTSFRYLGLLVTTEARVLSSSENGGGDVLILSEHEKQIGVFLPKQRRDESSVLSGYRPGDRVRVYGVATLYSPLPPYDRFYQILVSNPSGIILTNKAWPVPPSLLLGALTLIVVLLALWSLRERNLARQRATLRTLNALGEQVIGMSSPGEVVQKAMGPLSGALQISGAAILIYNRQTGKPESCHGAGTARAYADAQPVGGPLLEAADAAFRNRTLLAVPDSKRSPFFSRKRGPAPPRSALFVPMAVQGDLSGVLEIEHSRRVHYFTQEEQAAVQHLANQVAAALKQQEQLSIRDQMFRSEKLAAAGQLMAGIATELRGPVESILHAVELMSDREGGEEPRLAMIGAETQRAADIVRRLLAFSKSEDAEPNVIDLNAMLTDVAAVREREQRPRGGALRRQLATQPVIILGSRGQLEQVFLNLLRRAEQSLDVRSAGGILIASSLLARRAVVEISWPARPAELQEQLPIEACPMGLDVCSGIIHSHGGDIRFLQPPSKPARFEIELPIAEVKDREIPEKSGPRVAGRQLTILVVDPEAGTQKQLLTTFTKLGHRVVPVASAEEGADLVGRLRFDLTVCAVRLPGLGWADFLERVRGSVGGFVLLTDSYDPQLSRMFQASDVLVLSKPLDESELQRVCETLELPEETAASTG